MENEKKKFDFVQPFKDIPATLKGFPKNIVRIVKEPVKDFDGIAARRKEIYAYLYLSCILFALISALSFLAKEFMTVVLGLTFIPLVGICGCVFLLAVLNKAEEKFADLECPNCKARIEYDYHVTYKVANQRFDVTATKKEMQKSNSVLESMYVKVIGKEHTTFRITCKCQKCGTEKTFDHEFVTAECNKFMNKLSPKAAAELVVTFEQDVRAEGAEGFEHKTVCKSTDRGVEISYCPLRSDLIKGYFGDIIQMR